MTKKYPITYIHPTLDRKCIIESEWNCNYVTMWENILMKWEIKPFYFNESYLKSLWFIEAPTDTEEKGDWMDRAFEAYILPYEHIDKKYLEDFKKAIQKFMPKPVEQELVPLLPRDIVAITDEIITLDELGKVDEDRIHKILYKYWLPKQEEREDWTDEEIQQWMNNVRWWTEEAIKYGIKTIKWFLTFHWIHKGSFKKRSEMTLPTPTPQASVDEDELKTLNFHELMLYDMESMMYTQLYTLREQQTYENRINIAKSYIKKRQERGFFSLPIQKKRSKEELEKRYDDMLYKLKPNYKKKEVDTLMLWTVAMFLKDHWLLSE